MNAKMSIGVPVEIILDVVRMFNRGGLLAQVAPSNPDAGEIWFEVTFIYDNPRQREAFQNITEAVAKWNKLRYGDDSAESVMQKFTLL